MRKKTISLVHRYTAKKATSDKLSTRFKQHDPKQIAKKTSKDEIEKLEKNIKKRKSCP